MGLLLLTGCTQAEQNSPVTEVVIEQETEVTEITSETTQEEITVSLEVNSSVEEKDEKIHKEYNYSSGLLDKAEDCLQETRNMDVVGWIRMTPELQVDRAIVRGQDNNFYLNHAEDKQENKGGSVFADYRCIYGYTNDTDCLILYGHNMPDDSVFGGLDKYREQGFYEEHKTFEVSSLNHDALYEIQATIKSTATKDTNFDWWNYLDFTTKEEFETWWGYIQENNMLSSGGNIEYGDNICILCTCFDTVDDKYRYVLIAKQIA